jgi:hypothetical protein
MIRRFPHRAILLSRRYKEEKFEANVRYRSDRLIAHAV